MKCFYYFKDKSRVNGQSSAPNLKYQSKSYTSEAENVIQSSSSAPSPRGLSELYEEKAQNLRVFKFSELKQATSNFNRLLMIGAGGFGCVYKGTIKPVDEKGEPFVVAIKKLNRDGNQGHKEWVTEVKFLGVVDHPNLVKLIGYCAVDGERGIQRLLVYEYMLNKSLEDHLFNMSLPTLSWDQRLQIVLGAAQGLAYLHEESEVQVVGTYGYAAPDYIETGHLTSKSDVWSFGIVLYEILTGRRSVERERPRSEQKLLDWVKQYPADSRKFGVIMDSRLENQYSLSKAREVAKLADRCLVKSPKDRPKMSQVVESLKQIVRLPADECPPAKDFEGIEDEPKEEKAIKQTGVSESAKRRMEHLAKISENVDGVNRRRFMIMQGAKVI
ncbi:probable serine/threonine-protein kinase PBL19 isoform X2 [Olea europaea var. sylvestris]|uniref:probable serine/threonine-protein kinase PBL19 isoform X2 n=1 Tax=Olea europaea var. sylvestris TaxID=158386 RepID=UPI000C1CE109|nr:probable serine/threonine-protein kinase PBL19 isoform X2 [Olea europaea var. sylvestris]